MVGPWDRTGPAVDRRRREQTDLYATILEVVKRHHGQARITRISYGAGMPVDRLRASVDRLLTLGLLQVEDDPDRSVYDITARSQEFLNTYWKMRGFLDTLADSESSGPRP